MSRFNPLVKLEQYEIMLSVGVGVRRYLMSLENKHRNHYGERSWTSDIEGAAGEQAFAKACKMYWSGSVGTFKREGDVWNLEIRTRSQDWHDLIIRNDDKDKAIYVLVIGVIPNFKIIGWIYAEEGKKQEFYKDVGQKEGYRPAPAFFVPQRFLRPMDQLIRLIEKDYRLE